ncbi:MAG: DUF523 domain-containing protein [Spongiibacteraceae bacterium]
MTVAVSACLAGEKVRYDGDDRRLPVYPLLHTALQLEPICPELGAGLGVPRPPVRLVENQNELRALGRDNPALDVTAVLQRFAQQSLTLISSQHQLCGYLWKSRSPSCGFGSTPIFTADGIESDRGSGIQAAYFQRQLPHLSYGEETELTTENSALAFILRCRIVFDVLYATRAALSDLHRHYIFLHENFDRQTVVSLEKLAAENYREDYLTALLIGCRQMPEKLLLRLFIG